MWLDFVEILKYPYSKVKYSLILKLQIPECVFFIVTIIVIFIFIGDIIKII